MTPRGKVRARRRALAGITVTVVLLGFLLFTVIPTSTWWQQRQDTAEAEQQLAEVKAERARIAKEMARLETAEEIARRAKEELGYVKPGEEAYNILPAAQDPVGLPEGWPFTGVERALGSG